MYTRRAFYFVVNQRSMTGRHNTETSEVRWRNGAVFFLTPDSECWGYSLWVNTNRQLVDRFRDQDPDLLREMVDYPTQLCMPPGWLLYDHVEDGLFFSELLRVRTLFGVVEGGSLTYSSRRGGLYQVGQTLRVGWVDNAQPVDSDLARQWEETVEGLARFKVRKKKARLAARFGP